MENLANPVFTFAGPDYQKKNKEIEQRLLAPFLPQDMECRPGAILRGQSRAAPLFFIDSRAAIKRLRQVFGIAGFSIDEPTLTFGNEHEKSNGKEGLLVGCSLSIRIHVPGINIIVSNVGEKSLDETNYNKVTSAYAQAFKRACSNIGIGSYLYYTSLGFIAYDEINKRFHSQKIPDDTVEEALDDSGFKSMCEVTGDHIDWLTAAKSMDKFGKVLSVQGAKKLKEEGIL